MELRKNTPKVEGRAEVNTKDLPKEIVELANSNKLCIMRVKGYSMQPTIFHGDEVFIDRTSRGITNGEIYVFYRPLENGATVDYFVKRLFVEDDSTIKVVSDNETDYPPYFITREELKKIEIVGRVVHTRNTPDSKLFLSLAGDVQNPLAKKVCIAVKGLDVQKN